MSEGNVRTPCIQEYFHESSDKMVSNMEDKLTQGLGCDVQDTRHLHTSWEKCVCSTQKKTGSAV
eukprot:2727174-Rhodomonas_salina.1